MKTICGVAFFVLGGYYDTPSQNCAASETVHIAMDTEAETTDLILAQI